MTLSLLVALAFILTVRSLPAAAEAQCKLILVEEWKVRGVKNYLIIDGAIDGQPVGVMLDTGATRTTLLRSAAARLGLVARWSKRYTAGVGGLSQLSSAYVEEFRLGQSMRKGWRMMIAGEHDFGDDIAVILGEDFFRQFEVEFDLSENAVRLFQSRDCTEQSLAYWNEGGADRVLFEGGSDVNPQILVPVLLNGRAITALLDSGANSTVVSKTVAAGLGVNPDSPNVVSTGKSSGIGAKRVDTWIAPFETLKIGNEVLRNPKIPVHDLGKDTPMLLGVDFLRKHRVLVAHSQRRIYFTSIAPKAPTAEAEIPAEKTCDKDADCAGNFRCPGDQCASPSPHK